MFWRWRRIDEEDRRRVWVLYGWFSGLMCVGSVFGAAAWSLWMQFIATYFASRTLGLSHAQMAPLFAYAEYWSAPFYVAYAIEILCLSASKLMVLHRMTEFAMPKGDGVSRRCAVGGRVVMAAVVVGNVVGLCGNVAAAVFSKQAGDAGSAAAVAFAANKTDVGTEFYRQGDRNIAFANDAASVQQFCEVAVLLIINLAFAVVGIASARRVSSALPHVNDEQGAAGRQLRRQIVGTFAFVFVTFLLRAVFATMNAVSSALQNDGAACDSTTLVLCSSTCFNVYTLMQEWITFTPEFQLSIMLVSSPLATLVALWGMTSERTLEYMRSSGGEQSAIMRVRMMRG